MNNKNIIDIVEQNSDSSKYQVLITDIHWNMKSINQYKNKNISESEFPSQFALDLPENILNRANKKRNDFNGIIEEFCYNFLTRKFGKEVNRCQIWLPL